MALQGGYRLLFLSLVVLSLWIVAWATGVTGRFTSESVRSLLAGRGLWGVVAFTVVFSAGQLLRVPSFVFVAAAVTLYGRNFGQFRCGTCVRRTRACRCSKSCCPASAEQGRQPPGDDRRAAAAPFPNGTATQLCVTDDRGSVARSSGWVPVGPARARGCDGCVLRLGLAPYGLSSRLKSRENDSRDRYWLARRAEALRRPQFTDRHTSPLT